MYLLVSKVHPLTQLSPIPSPQKSTLKGWETCGKTDFAQAVMFFKSSVLSFLLKNNFVFSSVSNKYEAKKSNGLLLSTFLKSSSLEKSINWTSDFAISAFCKTNEMSCLESSSLIICCVDFPEI